MITNSVKCDKCGKLHDSDAATFFTVRGNILRGLNGGGIVGNNLDEHDKVSKESHFCFVTCMSQVLSIRPLKEAPEPPVERMGHAETCASMLTRHAPCNCNGGNYVLGRRGPRQLGEYDG